MKNAKLQTPAPTRTLRLWPGVLLVVIQLFFRFGVPAIMPRFEGFRIAIFGNLFGALGIAIWWLFFSRARKPERWWAIFLTFGCLTITLVVNHPSMRLMWLVGFALPTLSTALVVWAILTLKMPPNTHLKTLTATFVLACGFWTLVRSDGLTGAHVSQFHWRWTPTHEEELLARDLAPSPPSSSESSIPSTVIPEPSWPGFRGSERNGTIPGIRLANDWSQTPPKMLWRRPVGPGWSSFAVAGERLYTQEQLGEEELVVCHRTSTGEPIWVHRDPARFYEAMGGPGPRATPSLANGVVFTLGATGILNALDAANGSLRWRRDIAEDAGVDTPIWGFASSPLVVGDLVYVCASGKLIAYDFATGTPRWFGPEGGETYSSPQWGVLCGIPQLIQLCGKGAFGVAPSDGSLLWQHEWRGRPMVQPKVLGENQLLINAGEGFGLRKLTLDHRPDHWEVGIDWTSIRLKPNFNGYTIHRGHAFGFDGRILACIDLKDGTRKWKGGRYGQGQMLLLPDQSLLLLITEKGELALVEATPQAFRELGRVPAIEGKTWNHPALVDDLLLVRNGQEMAAFRLPLEKSN